MKYKYFLLVFFFGVCASAHAEWFLRGTHTAPSWAASQMVSAGAGTNTMQLKNVIFENSGSVKFDRFGDWFENYGVGGQGGSNIPVAAGKWDIKFFTDSKTWSITSATTAQATYHVRGTFNTWAEGTLMARVDSSVMYVSCINFVGGDVNGGPRFKVDPNGAWGDAVPAADFQVFPGWVKIIFNSSSNNISVEQSLAANCGSVGSSSSSATSSSSSSSSANSSSASSSSSASASFMHTFTSLNLRTSSNNWVSQPMALIANHVWEGQINTLRSSANLIKFDVTGNWSNNYGDNEPRNGVADQGGANIPVDGCYNFDCTALKVRFNDNTREYALCYNNEYHNDNGTTSLCNL